MRCGEGNSRHRRCSDDPPAWSVPQKGKARGRRWRRTCHATALVPAGAGDAAAVVVRCCKGSTTATSSGSFVVFLDLPAIVIAVALDPLVVGGNLRCRQAWARRRRGYGSHRSEWASGPAKGRLHLRFPDGQIGSIVEPVVGAGPLGEMSSPSAEHPHNALLVRRKFL